MSAECGRRDRALLATYTSEKDIEEARSRSLKDNQLAVSDIEKRIGGLKKREQDLTKELEFYTGKNQPPQKLQQDIANAKITIAGQAAKPGDLVFFYSPISHVGIYLTRTTMIDANHPGDVVNVRPIHWEYFAGAARP